MSTLRVLCYSGGVGSTALVLATLGEKNQPDLIIYPDTEDRTNGLRHDRARRVLMLCRRFKVPFHWLEPGPGTYCERVRAYLESKYPGADVVLVLGYLAGEDSAMKSDPCLVGAETPLVTSGTCICRATRALKRHGFKAEGEPLDCPVHK